MVICSFDLNCTLLDNASIWPFGMTQVQELKLSCLFHFRFPASLCCLLVKCLAICERHLTIVCTQHVVGDEFISRLSTFLLDLVWTFCGLSTALSVSVLYYFGTTLDFYYHVLYSTWLLWDLPTTLVDFGVIQFN